MLKKKKLFVFAGLLALLPVLAFTLPKLQGNSLSEDLNGIEVLLTEAGRHARGAADLDMAKAGSWAKATLDSMTLDEKIGQLFMIAAYSNKNEAHNTYIQNLVAKEKIGGLIFMQGGPGRQIALINRYQKAAKVPLLIAQDAEWGLGMRLDSTISFPKNMTLGAIRDSMIIFELGMEVGRQCRRVGVQVNFAPVVDVNNNPDNPVINVRSFGENRDNVATKGLFFYKGMEYSGTIGCAKHFPGHGDTDTDSHKDLPVIPFSRARLDSLELYPFRKMIRRGVASIMIAHLYIPSLDTTANLASTLSPKIVTDLLQTEIGFKGLIFTDALSMKGVTKFWEEGETDLKAFLAGNDVLLFSSNVPKAKKLIREAIKAGDITEKELNRRVLKILIAKEWTGLNKNKITPPVQTEELNGSESHSLVKRLYQKSVTVLKNDDDLLPLGKLQKRNIAVLEIGPVKTSMADYFKLYAPIKQFKLKKNPSAKELSQLLADLKPYNTVLVTLHGMKKSARYAYGVSSETRKLLAALKSAGAGKKEVVVILPGSPYSAKYFGKHENALLVAYEENKGAMEAAAEAVFGAYTVDGRLPITASAQFPEGTGVVVPAAGRFQFALPAAAGMDAKVLTGIDSIAKAAIKMGATPGCVVMVMRGNKVVYSKGFGRTEYGSKGVPVDAYETVYDLASVTKIAATTVTTMKLVSEGKIDVEESVSAYLSDFRGRGMTHIKVKNLLMHNAGFKSWIPFYRDTFDSTGKALREDLYSTTPNDTFCIKITEGLYMCTDYQDSMWTKIVNSKIKTDSRVRYSDLSMIVMRRVIEVATGEPFDRYVDSVFYGPMGMNSTCFNPWQNLPGRICAPTEDDGYWRNKKVQGYVHDQAAAMLGGVSGHAGLFANVYDLSKMLLMVKNGGQYGDQKYFDFELVDKFTAKQLNNNRKGLGWDKAEMDTTRSMPTSRFCSEKTYGHTGFTGIGAWVDPQYDLMYIFLSNRTFPSSENKKLLRENIRPNIQDVIYKSIFAYEKRRGGD